MPYHQSLIRGHLTTFSGPKGVRIRGAPLYIHVLYFLEFFLQLLLISVHANMRVQLKGENKTRVAIIIISQHFFTRMRTALLADLARTHLIMTNRPNTAALYS